MSDVLECGRERAGGAKAIPVEKAAGMVLAHDVTEIRSGEFKGSAFRKGHVVREEDIDHFRRLGKESLFVLSLGPDEAHEDEAALALADALRGPGVTIEGEPREGKINLIAEHAGLLKINEKALLAMNMLGQVMCATRHTNTLVKKGRIVAGTRAIPLVIKWSIVDEAAEIGGRAKREGSPMVEVKKLRKPRVGVVITGNEVYHGRIQDAFAPVIAKKIKAINGEIVGLHYAPDDEAMIEERLHELLHAGADLLITTGGMSVDPDDVTRFAIRNIGARDIVYGSAVLPGAMFLVAYLRNAECGIRNSECTSTHSALHTLHSEIPILGIPACGMYHAITIFDLILPRVLAGETIGRRELAELGHGGLCLNCRKCRYPVCPFGK
ncbi:MAG TPA: molybdopterin-binding protein [Nitrospiraceae bacterium]|nr:molybdopterin-binding protein [Nitrospiraceae bacterium]